MSELLLVKEKEEKREVLIQNVKVKNGNFVLFAGPCAVESKDQVEEIALRLKECGVDVLRGGTFKPRTSPYSFQGLEVDGMKYLHDAGKKAGIPVITEVVDEYSLNCALDYVDAVQIGARNMQNFSLLKKVGKLKIPVVLKRGFYCTINEWLNAAEYILSEGNQNLILCERGIRTISEETRNTMDISAIPVIKKISSLPIIVDPSHACGIREYVLPLSLAAVAVGADGLMIEVQINPEKAISDARQTIDIDELERIVDKTGKIRSIL
ncbi:3-deoxy-7-phosphoheptulonate synthase [Anaerocolumna xylanovorans]|uniref:3-deoxy-7-phosphoheptulonate synthase n=1 Tax=Anaerocolumna xylanovorans TaxID=100134 RepID=UPI00093612A4|nr:3-deoxy-7-phosphoheptulonate synthase [Anaerocolumna xylanovorans]